jgi:alanine racemase
VVINDLSPFVSGTAYIEALAKAAGAAGKALQVHLKVDTGMGRAGCRPEEAAALAECILSYGNLRLAGVATHLAVSDSLVPADMAYTRDQLRRFNGAVRAIRAAGIDSGILHAANTGGVLYYPDSWFDMVRPGLLLYGCGPRSSGLALRPLMELRSRVSAVKSIRKGESVSYGRTWMAAEDTLVALIPAGYADGLRRALSNNWLVGIRGRAYPIVGRICMDQCMADLGKTGDGVVPGDEVVLFGEPLGIAVSGGAVSGIAIIDGANYGDASLMAEKLGTIPHEITCGISKRVPRIYAG